MDERSRRVSAISEAAYEAAKKAMDEIQKEETIVDEEATGVFATGLLWPAINYLVSIGIQKEDVIRVVSNMVDDMNETDVSATLN